MNKGVLLVNLGSPDSTSVGDVRRYLNEFLMDGRVIDTPWLLRRFIVGMILINRPKQSAEAYKKSGRPKVRRSSSRANGCRRNCKSASPCRWNWRCVIKIRPFRLRFGNCANAAWMNYF